MNHDLIIGHNSHIYSVVKDWGRLDASRYPVKDCHEMIMDSKGRLFMLTNETKNNILVYNKSGELEAAWGNEYPGAHGLTISNENGREFLFITDVERHQVFKTDLEGKVIQVIGFPKGSGEYATAAQYKPTETAIAPNGDIYITDGYGLQFVIQYNSRGEYIRHWGGRGDEDAQFDCVHGITIDNRNAEESILLITSRNHTAIKKFTREGKYLGKIELPGSYICRPVVHKKNIYCAVFRSVSNQNVGSGYITILDENNLVVSSPGATSPVYIKGILQAQEKSGNTFIHPHDVCVDDDDNLYIPQWNSGNTYPVKLKRIQ